MLGVIHVGADVCAWRRASTTRWRSECAARHVVLSEAGTRIYPVEIRYAWPAELDLMARLAGLELRDRWDGWDLAPFTAARGSHVSVYARPSRRG